MSVANFVSDEEVAVLDKQIDDDEFLPMSFKSQPILREILRAGLWLVSELKKLNCDESLIMQFQYTHGSISFGRDPWAQAKLLLEEYNDKTYTVSES